jgi:hypothetical protein
MFQKLLRLGDSSGLLVLTVEQAVQLVLTGRNLLPRPNKGRWKPQ